MESRGSWGGVVRKIVGGEMEELSENMERGAEKLRGKRTIRSKDIGNRISGGT